MNEYLKRKMIMTSEATKIFPKASELSKILNNLECPEEECTEVFQNSPNLTLHLLKTHGKERSLKSSTYGCKNAQFYCPEVGCKYCFNPEFDDSSDSKKFSNRYFTQFKYLKQHYIKVHLDKTYICDKCNKGFPTELHRSRHFEVCGNKYSCSCGAEYSMLATLQTHARREQHVYNVENLKGQNNRYRKSSSTKVENQSNNNNNSNSSECNVEVVEKNFKNDSLNSSTSSLLLLPEGTSILFLDGLVELEKNENQDISHNMLCQSTQTETVSKRRKNLCSVKGIVDKPLKKRTSAQTQTGEKRPKKTTETQTSFHCFSPEEKRKSARNNFSGTAGRKRKKSMETQTQNNCHNSIYKFNNNNNGNCNSDINNEYQYSSTSNGITNDTRFDESISFSNTIAHQDICLPQLWLNAENVNTSQCSVKDNPTSVYLTEQNNSAIKGAEIVPTMQFDLEKKANYGSVFYERSDFVDKGTTKESSSCHIETQTDSDSAINSLIDDYLTNCDGGIPEDDLLDQYTRWTQTCDDIILPDDIALDFTNNETQTAWSLTDDTFISDVVHSETQTPVLNIEDYILHNT